MKSILILAASLLLIHGTHTEEPSHGGGHANRGAGAIRLANLAPAAPGRNSPQAQLFLDRILEDPSGPVPDALDWRQTPARVTRVKYQGACSSSWAFAATGALEGQLAGRGAGQLLELSEQNLIDCDRTGSDDSPGAWGCDGGSPGKAFEFIHKSQAGCLSGAETYRYRARVDKVCHFERGQAAIWRVAGAARLPAANEETLRQVVARYGPVAVSFDATDPFLALYKGGVYYNPNCRPDKLTHSGLVVGYGSEKSSGNDNSNNNSSSADFWIVKLSWGASWGERGYLRTARNRENNCGIASEATIPIFE